MKYTVDSDAYARECQQTLERFADVISGLQLYRDYGILRSLSNAVDGAGAKLKLNKRSLASLTPQDFKEE